MSNRTIQAIDRLEARGGWDEADLNDFAIVREAVSNPASSPDWNVLMHAREDQDDPLRADRQGT